MADAVPVPLPPPYRGQNSLFPLVSIQNPFAERVDNFNNEGGSLNLRQGNRIHATQEAVGFGPLHLSSYENGTIGLIMLGSLSGGLRWYDVTSGTPSLVHTLAVAADDEIHTLYFNGYLFFFGEVNLNPASTGPQFYNGTTWGTSTYTWPSNFNPFGGCVYRNRAYFIGRLSAEFGWSRVDSISGTVEKQNLAGELSSKGYLFVLRAISSSENLQAETVFAMAFSNGEILYYAGSYPKSSDWRSVGRFKVSRPLYYNTAVDAKGDSILLTDSEIISLRGLFQGGLKKEREEGIGAAINKRYKQIIQALKANNASNVYFIRGVYDDVQDRLFINFPYYVDPVTGAVEEKGPFQLVYDFSLQGWYEYYQKASTTTYTYITGVTYRNGKVFCLALMPNKGVVIELEGKDNYLDDDPDGSGEIGIPYKLKSAPLPIPKFGVMVANAIEMIVKTDLWAGTFVYFIKNLGSEVTSGQALSGSGTSVFNAMADLGIEGNVIQYEVSGESIDSEVGLELYATNLWLVPSEGVAR